MIQTKPDIRTIISRVTDFGRKPTTPAQVLQQAHDLLSQEGRWIKDEMFLDGDPAEAYEASACGSWGVCALGAIGIVSGEMPVKVERYSTSLFRSDWEDAVCDGHTDQSLADFMANPPDYLSDFSWIIEDVTYRSAPLSHRAAEYLASVTLPPVWGDVFDPLGYSPDEGEAESVVTGFNDAESRTRSQVLKAFQKAITAAKGDPVARARAKDKR